MDIGMTTWSTQPKTIIEALETAKKLGMDCVHLGFFDDASLTEAVLQEIETWLSTQPLVISATCLAFDGEDYSSLESIHRTGGYLPDEDFPARLEKTRLAALATQRLGVGLLTAHAGFIPGDQDDPAFARMVERIRGICDFLAGLKLRLGLESGQEQASELLAFLDAVDRPNLVVNYDPANMILYGNQQPLEALEALRPRVEHVHMKDATWTEKPGTWGTEVPLGEGEVGIERILKYLVDSGYEGSLVIEREAGDDRVGDIAKGKELLDRFFA